MNLLEVYTQLVSAAASLSQMFDEFGGEIPDQPAIALGFVKADLSTVVETVRQMAADELVAATQPGNWVIGEPSCSEKVETLHAHLRANGYLSEYVVIEEATAWTRENPALVTEEPPTVEQRCEALEERYKRLEATINIMLMKNELSELAFED